MFTAKPRNVQPQTTVDQTTTLCLACSASLPPTSSLIKATIFTTPCCSRPICPTCISSNPRLARYDPCIACLGGVGVVSPRNGQVKDEGSIQPKNVDGAVQDEDAFVLGDDEDDEEDETSDLSPPPPYASSHSSSSVPSSEPTSLPEPSEVMARPVTPQDAAIAPNISAPPTYYIMRSDTLQGIAFRFGVDGRELCRLNNLPPSTLSTTPHILHTRTTLVLPPSAQGKSDSVQPLPKSDRDQERESRRARERAEKRLQTLTKEVDWRVAKAYVALADDPDEAEHHALKYKEGSSSATPRAVTARNARQPSLEGVALDRYLDDEEWEEGERNAGRIPAIPPLPRLNHNTEELKGKGTGQGVPARRFR